MNGRDIFRGLQYIGDDLIENAETGQFPAQNQESGKTRRPIRRPLLIAALIALLLLLVGCAAYAMHWYTTYFSLRREEPLSDSQVSYIQENAQDFYESQTYDGYTITLKSAFSEMNLAYVTFGLTAPAGTDLGFALGDEEDLRFEYLFAGPADTKLPANLSFRVLDDGDGENNTLNFVLVIEPKGSILEYEGIDTSFGKGHPWRIVLKNPEKIGYDQEYEQELLRTKYAGQTDYMLESDEASRIRPHTQLAEGRWEFVLEFDGADMQSLELIQEPILAKAMVTRRDSDATFYETAGAIEEITVTSVKLHALGATVTFIPPGTIEGSDFPIYHCAWMDMGDTYNPLTKLVNGDENFFVMLKDGTRIDFFQQIGADDTAELTADSPIVLEEVDYLQLSDGTRLYPPSK